MTPAKGEVVMEIARLFTRIASAIAQATGRPTAFIACFAVVIAWALSGPVFGYSDTWQLVINTGTTIITFLMVFLIQNTQNRDSAAIQVKLDELIRSHRSARNQFIGVEHLTEDELEEVRALCERAATRPVKERKAKSAT
jgi:low affinity Fe/Cu permease